MSQDRFKAGANLLWMNFDGPRILRSTQETWIVTKEVKKGAMVRLNQEKFNDSVEAKASDRRLPPYVFEGKGEVVEVEGDYAQVKFPVVTPTVWLRLEQLEAVE